MHSKIIFCTVVALLLGGCATVNRGPKPLRYRPRGVFMSDIVEQNPVPTGVKEIPPRKSETSSVPVAKPVPQPPAPSPRPSPRPNPVKPATRVDSDPESVRLRELVRLGFLTQAEYDQQMELRKKK